MNETIDACRVKEQNDDLAMVPRKTKRLYIWRKTKNLDCLKEFDAVEFLTLSELDEGSLDIVTSHITPRWVVIWDQKGSDISPLSKWVNLERLVMSGASKITDFSPISALRKLELFSLEHAPKARDLAPFEPLTNLRSFRFAGGRGGSSTGSKQVPSLKPLAALKALRHINLAGVNAADRSLAPLAELRQLEEIDLSNNWPTEEFARLSVLFPDAGCEWFVPYVEDRMRTFTAHDSISYSFVTITGSRKPYFSRPTDKDWEKIREYEKQFRDMQRAFQEQYGLLDK